MRSHIGTLSVLVGVMCLLPWYPSASAEGVRGGFDEAFGPRFHPDIRPAPPELKTRPRPGVDQAASVRHWNRIAIDASGLDHTPVAPGESRVFGEQLGPGRSSRAMAIVHLAVFEVVNAVEGDYGSYIGLGRAKIGTSMKAGIAQAAHDTLAALFPSQSLRFDEDLAEELAEIPEGRLKTNGIALGKRSAAGVLAARANDGSQH
ncbi:MAG: hypothetical protein K2X32_15600, partial [Phycisphaerales bacterium]|nr:hypothetical protein [Phycisphaerales bacterium]